MLGTQFESPRSRSLTEISRLLAKSPELAGLRAGAWSPRAAKWILTAISAPLSLALKFRFLGNRDGFAENSVRAKSAAMVEALTSDGRPKKGGLS